MLTLNVLLPLPGHLLAIHENGEDAATERCQHSRDRSEFLPQMVPIKTGPHSSKSSVGETNYSVVLSLGWYQDRTLTGTFTLIPRFYHRKLYSSRRNFHYR